ncbi:MAG: hypothetical protein IPL70_15445 [Uliginosibacterium sp.]|nr:hypothetical protein [Uliginosibacterium sp.]
MKQALPESMPSHTAMKTAQHDQFRNHLAPLPRCSGRQRRLIRARVLKVWRALTSGHSLATTKSQHSIVFLIRKHLDLVLADFVEAHLPPDAQEQALEAISYCLKRSPQNRNTTDHSGKEKLTILSASAKFRRPSRALIYRFEQAPLPPVAYRSPRHAIARKFCELRETANDLIDLIDYATGKSPSEKSKKQANVKLLCKLCERPTEYAESKLTIRTAQVFGTNISICILPAEKEIPPPDTKKSLSISFCRAHNQKNENNEYSASKKATRNFEEDARSLSRHFSKKYIGLVPDEITTRLITSGIIRAQTGEEKIRAYHSTLLRNEPLRLSLLKGMFEESNLADLFEDPGLARISVTDFDEEAVALVHCLRPDAEKRIERLTIQSKQFVSSLMSKLSKLLDVRIQHYRSAMISIDALGLRIMFGPEGTSLLFKPRFVDILVANRYFFVSLPTKDELQSMARRH